MSELTAAEAGALVDELQRQLRDAHGECARFTTHISEVLLAGSDAYKFRKPVALGFLDFTTLAARRHDCEREIVLNRRYAPTLYHGVRALRRDAAGLRFDGDGEILDYVVWMRRFPDGARLDRLVERGVATPELFASLGRFLGDLHRASPRAPAGTPFGEPALARAQMLAGIEPLAGLRPEGPALIVRYREHVEAAMPRLATRHREGFIRDCHGDLHLSNLVRFDDQVVPFDCLEFSDELRYIDTLSDFAFLKMDLDFRALPHFANTLLNHYLAACGDYAQLGLLRLYCAYRSMVRAKVAWLGSRALADEARATALARAAAHLDLVATYLAPPPPPRLVITYGVSGSGKSWQSQALAARHGFIHLRSDVERRRLLGLAPDAASGSAPGAGAYTAAHNTTTYTHLERLARALLVDGYSVIVDATFLRAADRAAFRTLAAERRADFSILECDAPPPTLRARIAARRAAGGDPSEADEAVLERQLATREPLRDAELAVRITADAFEAGGRGKS